MLAACTLSAAFAHYTWVVAAAMPFVVGKSVKIMVAHGDRFPHTDEAVNAAQVKLYVLAPSGARTDLKATAEKIAVSSTFTPREAGTHRIVFTQDRGPMSRTPNGVKPGGRDRNPNATEAFSLIRTGVSYVGSGANTALGLDLELTAQLVSGVWQLQLLRNGKPVVGEAVQVLLQEHEDAIAVGKTGADGRLVYKPVSSPGPLLFLAEVKEKVSGMAINFRTLSTSTYVNW